MTAGRSVRLLAVTAIAVVAVGAGLLASSSASLNAQTANRGNVWSFTAVYAPSSLTAVTTGHDVALGWAAGANGNGYGILGVANGSSSNCSSVTFGALGNSAGTTYTDTGRFTPQGTYFCYQVQTTYSSWTSVNGNPTVAARLGFFAASIAATNGGTPGRLDTGDRIVLTFNQAVTPSTGPSGTNTVCARNGNDTITLGAIATTGNCAATETNNLGTVTGGTLAANGRWLATWAWSAGNTVLTVTLGLRVQGPNNVTTTGTWAFTPVTTATKLLSSTGSFHVCDTNTGGGNCLPALTGSF
jgi:hypothetical protein